jgi:murein DD-endopeptidase MepM/ murein hydrolase activator NlpD
MGFRMLKRPIRVLSYVVIFGALLAKPSLAVESLGVECLPSLARQGEVCLVRVKAPESLESIHGVFRGKRFEMTRDLDGGVYQGLLGLDMNASPGESVVKVVAKTADQEPLTGVFALRIEKTDFALQKLTLPKGMVDLDTPTLERVKREKAKLMAALGGYSVERLWILPFIRPVEGDITTAFGLRRTINGQPRSPHTGLDLRASHGTPIRACNHGVVVLVDDMFFSGKSVVLDHGWGLYSMYFHLSEIRVELDDRVAKGYVVGRAGSTGRATGPHLHWGIRLDGARVDPLALLGLSKYLEE